VWFVITKCFSVSDLSVFWDVCRFDKDTCVGSGDVMNALKKASDFVAKASFQSGCSRGSTTVLAWCCWDQWRFVGAMAMWAVSIPPKSSWDKFWGERFCERFGTLGGAGRLIIGVTNLGSNGMLVMS
jgi:hypothetical protein